MSAQWYYATIGVEWRTERHPMWPDAHPDGYVSVRADSETQARRILHGWLGRDWCSLLVEPPPLDKFPRGCLRSLDVSSYTSHLQVADR